jgi:hypothetical protein
MLVKISKLQYIISYISLLSFIRNLRNMGRHKNDGLGRFGGRQKGSTNKPPVPLNEWVLTLVNRNRTRFEKDVETLNPQERAKVFANLIAISAQGGVQEPITAE